MNGLLLINKPSGMTSHDVVARVRRAAQTREVGHSGTLDPMAQGLMVLLIGEATKLSSFVTEGDKSYEVGIKLGVVTDTLDVTGAVLKESPVTATEVQVKEFAQKFEGEYLLNIPIFSAKKVDGKKLYEYAREGIDIEIPKKNMKFWNVRCLGENRFHLHCSKGSFIRSWVSELGEKLGCGATMQSLIRTSSHRFALSDANDLEQIEGKTPAEIAQMLVPLDQALMGVKSIRIKGQDEVLMKNGQISHNLRTQLISRFNPSLDEIIQILPEERGRLLAIIGLEKGQGFRIKRVFNY